MRVLGHIVSVIYNKLLREHVDRTVQRHLVDYPSEQLFFDTIGSVVTNQVQGDYLEFGVYSGDSFAKIYHLFNHHWKKYQTHAQLNSDQYDQSFLAPIRFFAFDSFEGLPGSDLIDTPLHFRKKGAYGKPEKTFLANLAKQNVDSNRVVVVPGWFTDTLTEETKHMYSLCQASLIFIDCDLYESVVPVLDFITNLIQDGTVIIIDDFFRYKGIPNKGIRRAFSEWLTKNPQIGLSELSRCSANRVAFICYTCSDDYQKATSFSVG